MGVGLFDRAWVIGDGSCVGASTLGYGLWGVCCGWWYNGLVRVNAMWNNACLKLCAL